MTDSQQSVNRPILSLNRLEALTDGVFAIVMTLLVLGLSVHVIAIPVDRLVG